MKPYIYTALAIIGCSLWLRLFFGCSCGTSVVPEAIPDGVAVDAGYDCTMDPKVADILAPYQELVREIQPTTTEFQQKYQYCYSYDLNEAGTYQAHFHRCTPDFTEVVSDCEQEELPECLNIVQSKRISPSQYIFCSYGWYAKR